MTFSGPAEQDLEEMLELLPRDFTTEMVVSATGWPVKKARQAIVWGMSQDRIIPRDSPHNNNHTIYENVAWRKEWVTKRWAA